MSDVSVAAHPIATEQPTSPPVPPLSDEDRRAITDFFDRLRAVDLPRDPGAEVLIAELIAREPKLRYIVTQLAFFQEHALAAAQTRIQELEYQLEQKQGGFFSSLFGSRSAAPPPRPIQAPGATPGMFNPSHGGFLGGAGGLAVGVLGGALLGAAVMSALEPEPAAAAPASAPVYDDGDDDGGFDVDSDY